MALLVEKKLVIHHVRNVRSILALALPMSASSIITILAIIINTAVLGRLNHNNLYLLALFLPVNYLQIAIMEAFRAPALVMSAIYCQNKQADLFCRKIISLIIMVSVVVLLSVFLFLVLQHFLVKIFNIPVALQIEFLNFTKNMLLLGVLVCVNYILNSILYALGKQHIAMILNVATAVIICSLTYVFGVHCGCEIDSLLYAIAISNGVGIIIALYFLNRLGLFKKSYLWPNLTEHRQVLAQVSTIALPIGCSYLLLFSTLLLFNKILSYFGTATVAGFGVAYRVQTFVILPALALGMAIAILINHTLAQDDVVKAKKILQTGILLSLLFYLIIAPILYRWRYEILAWMTLDVVVLHAANSYFSLVVFSYVGFGPLLVFLIMLDQTGSGIKSLFYSVIAFSLECGFGGLLALHTHNLVVFYKTIASINFLSLLLVFWECFARKKIPLNPPFTKGENKLKGIDHVKYN